MNQKEKGTGERNKHLKYHHNVMYSLLTAPTSCCRVLPLKECVFFLNMWHEEVLGVGIHYYTLRVSTNPSSRTLSQRIPWTLMLRNCTCYAGMLQTPSFWWWYRCRLISVAVIIHLEVFNKLNWILCVSFLVHLSDHVVLWILK